MSTTPLTIGALIEQRASSIGAQDFFICDDGLSTSLQASCYIVHEAGGPEPPGPPAQVRAERDPSTGMLVVAWAYDWGASHYEIWRSSTPGTRGTRIGLTRLTRFVDNNAAAGQSYYYSIRALNSAGKSAFARTSSASR